MFSGIILITMQFKILDLSLPQTCTVHTVSRMDSPMSKRFTYSDQLQVCPGSNSFGNFLLRSTITQNYQPCPTQTGQISVSPLSRLGSSLSLTFPTHTKATMMVLSGFFLMISIVSCQVTVSTRDQQNLRIVSNETILSTFER